jgi:hypothetical protein
MPNLRAVLQGGAIFAVANERAPEPADWEVYMTQLAEAFTEADGHPVKLVIFAGGGVPNASMRLKLREVVASRPLRTAVVTDSSVVRAIIGVFSLFVAGTRPFSPSDWRAALDYVGYLQDPLPQLVPALRRLDVEVRGSRAAVEILRP